MLVVHVCVVQGRHDMATVEIRNLSRQRHCGRAGGHGLGGVCDHIKVKLIVKV